MLLELRVENLLLIEQARLRLAPGLNVLTGETGAGKTVLAHALDLLLGGRPREGIVRPGADDAYVEGTFEIPPALADEIEELLGEAPAGAENDREIVLARRVRADGRTRALINGRAAAVADLRAVGGTLVSFYGQHEHRKLTLAGAQLAVLDSRCGPGHEQKLRACGETYERVGRLEAQLESFEELLRARERELELIDFELAEIDAVAPDPAEHEQLLVARERLRRLDSLLAAAAAAAGRLGGEPGDSPPPDGPPGIDGTGSAQLTAEAASALAAVAGADPDLDALSERARSLALETQELASELACYRDRAVEERDGAAGAQSRAGGLHSLDVLEERLAGIERLARKHGGSIDALLDYAHAARRRRAELADAEVSAGEARDQLEAARAELQERIRQLRRARRAAAAPFAEAVREQLASLAMPGASFEVELGESEPGPAGADAVEFLVAPNPGVPGGPVREIASGGELSRIMLAIMSVAGTRGEGATLVFDEVDAGIGGHTARALGERLRELAATNQILCITHLAQVASLASRHFAIAKRTEGDSTCTTVRELSEEDALGELARMLGADGDAKAARRHASELLRAA
jgi:DNA repair protein RecN (Recombination protein N)